MKIQIPQSVKVSDPNKGDLVTVTWSVSSGDLSTTTGENVQWTAPFDTMIVQVSAIARDDKNNAARDEVSIHVGNSPPHISTAVHLM